MKNLADYITKWITAAIILTIGILCIVTNAASGQASATAYESISVVLGVVFIIVSALALCAELALKRSVATIEGISAGFLLSAGIFFVVGKYAVGTLLGILVDYIPYVLLVLGSLFVFEGLLVLTVALMEKKDNYVYEVVIEITAGLVAILFGVLAFTVDGIKNNKFMILGIILIIYAIINAGFTTYRFLLENKNKPVIIDAEVHEVNEEQASSNETKEASENN